jgi:cytochrome c oxidase cbb3-type subunit 3
MSDFTSNFWSVYVTGIALVGILACLLLLWFSGKAKAMTANDNTTGHVWDGDLREMNNPLPRWWVGLFIITIVFALLYLALYPGLGNFAGKLGWTSVGQYNAEVAKGNEEVAPLYARFAGMQPPEIANDPQAMAIGDRLFMNNCAQCHGSDARGSKGFPNLTDADWLHGGTPEKIKETLLQGRIGQMPPMAAAVGSPEDVRNVAHYVLSLSGSPHDSLRASLGKSKFGVCAACHGMDGKGNPVMGAPNLTDDIWLHGWGEAAIVSMINNGKINQMPAQAGKLTEGQIQVLAAYVWGLSNKGAAAGVAK